VEQKKGSREEGTRDQGAGTGRFAAGMKGSGFGIKIGCGKKEPTAYSRQSTAAAAQQ